MSFQVLTTERVEINGVDISASCTSAGIEVKANEIDSTTFGTGWETKLGGLKSFGLKFEANTDYAAGQLDAMLWPLLGTVVTMKIRPTSAAISTSNPEYQGSVLVSGLTPVTGKVGDLATTSGTWPGSGALVRATA